MTRITVALLTICIFGKALSMPFETTSQHREWHTRSTTGGDTKDTAESFDTKFGGGGKNRPDIAWHARWPDIAWHARWPDIAWHARSTTGGDTKDTADSFDTKFRVGGKNRIDEELFARSTTWGDTKDTADSSVAKGGSTITSSRAAITGSGTLMLREIVPERSEWLERSTTGGDTTDTATSSDVGFIRKGRAAGNISTMPRELASKRSEWIARSTVSKDIKDTADSDDAKGGSTVTASRVAGHSMTMPSTHKFDLENFEWVPRSTTTKDTTDTAVSADTKKGRVEGPDMVVPTPSEVVPQRSEWLARSTTGGDTSDTATSSDVGYTKKSRVADAAACHH